MPFLVDSITMELARHGLSARLVVHPQLRIRRDVTGAMREVGGPGQRRRADARRAGRVVDAHRDRQAGRRRGQGARPMTCSGCCSDVRVAVEDGSRMRAKALYLAEELLDQPAGAGAGEDAESRPGDRRAAALAGRRPVHVPGLPGVRPGAGAAGDPGAARCPAPAWASCATTRADPSAFAALPPESSAQALDPQRLIVTKANSRSTVHRPSYLDYVAIKRIDADGQGGRRAPVPRACTRTWPSPRASPASRWSGASWPTCCPRWAWPPTATTATTSPRCWSSTRARSCS